MSTLRLQNSKFIGRRNTTHQRIALQYRAAVLIRQFYNDVYPQKRGRFGPPVDATLLALTALAVARTTTNQQLKVDIMHVMTAYPTIPQLLRNATLLPYRGTVQNSERTVFTRCTPYDEILIRTYLTNNTLRSAMLEIQGYHELNGYPVEFLNYEIISESKSIQINTFTVGACIRTESEEIDVSSCVDSSEEITTPEPTRGLCAPDTIQNFSLPLEDARDLLGNENVTIVNITTEVEEPGTENSVTVTRLEGNIVRPSRSVCFDDSTNLIGNFTVVSDLTSTRIIWETSTQLPRETTSAFPSVNVTLNPSTLLWFLFTFLVAPGQWVSASYINKSEYLNNNIQEFEIDALMRGLLNNVLITPVPQGEPTEFKAKRENVTAPNVEAHSSGVYSKNKTSDVVLEPKPTATSTPNSGEHKSAMSSSTSFKVKSKGPGQTNRGKNTRTKSTPSGEGGNISVLLNKLYRALVNAGFNIE